MAERAFVKSILKQETPTPLAVSISEPPATSRVPRVRLLAQTLLGLGAYIAFALPYLRKTSGMDRLRPQERYLFVANHVSLLDTILLGALCWRSRCYPILVLGDKGVWRTSWLKRALSGPIGFLLERGKLNLKRIEELQTFGRAIGHSNLVVYPEGTRGDGISVGACQPGVYFIAQEARASIVPIFIRNMQLVSTKGGRFHPVAGLRKIEVHFGEAIAPAAYLSLTRDEFTQFIRQKIAQAGGPA